MNEGFVSLPPWPSCHWCESTGHIVPGWSLHRVVINAVCSGAYWNPIQELVWLVEIEEAEGGHRLLLAWEWLWVCCKNSPPQCITQRGLWNTNQSSKQLQLWVDRASCTVDTSSIDSLWFIHNSIMFLAILLDAPCWVAVHWFQFNVFEKSQICLSMLASYCSLELKAPRVSKWSSNLLLWKVKL